MRQNCFISYLESPHSHLPTSIFHLSSNSIAMKKLFFLSILSLLTCSAFAQDPTAVPVDTSWKTGGFINISSTQVGFSNWAAGGENSFSVGGSVLVFANYAKDKIEWNNTLNLGYAMLQSGSSIRKSDDKIDFTSKYGRRTSTHWYLTALVNFKSQFANGFSFPNDSVIVSHFMAPGYLMGALGMDYKPNDHFSLFLSPATGKFTFVNDEKIADLGTYGNKKATYGSDGKLLAHGDQLRKEFGAYVRALYKSDIMENVNLLARLELFNNYTDENSDNARNVDVNGELLINMKVNKFITATFNVVVIYDHDVDTNPESAGTQRRLQLKEVIGVGFGYKF